MEVTTSMVPQICPTYTPSVTTFGGAPQQSPLYLVVKLNVTVCLFNVHLFLAEFYCAYSQFDPGSVVIKSILNSQMEIQIFLQNSTLNENFAEKLLQVWQNETERNEVFSAQTRNQV